MIDRMDSTAGLLTRRDFTLQSALALLAGVVVTVEGCGSSTSPTAPTPVNDVTGGISANHGHVAVVTSAQITASNAISLNIQGTSTHNHTVDLTQADLGTLKSRGTVTKDSSAAPHIHTVTFTPA